MPPGPRDFRSFLIRSFIATLTLSFRIFLYRPYTVTGSSMANTLLEGDHIFSNIWLYGPNLLGKRRLGVRILEPGKVLLFHHPKDPKAIIIKRCVAIAGQTIQISNKRLLVNGKLFDFPKRSLSSKGALVPGKLSSRDEIPILRLPQLGESIILSGIDGLEFDYVVSLIRQENPHDEISISARLLVNGSDQSDMILEDFALASGPFNKLPIDSMGWTDFRRILIFLNRVYPNDHIQIKRSVMMNAKALNQYIVKDDCFFAMSDNWDKFSDSRIWGYVSNSAVIGRASFIYWSRDHHKKWYLFFGTRWSRFGKIIR